MNNTLILLTNYYPFFKGEEYLETEIDYLSSEFEKIIIFPTMASNKMKINRPLPSNVQVVNIDIDLSRGKKIQLISKTKMYINKEFKQILKEEKHLSIINKLYSTYFEARSNYVYSKITKELNKINFSGKKVTIYSYWFYVTARVAVSLKNKYFKDKDIYTVSRAHRYDLYENEAPLKFLPHRNYLLKNLDQVFPCSQNGAEFLTNNYPIYKDKIEVKRLGTTKQNIKVKKPKQCFRIVTCSALRKVKRVDMLVDALEELDINKINYEWVHIGSGTEFDKIKSKAEKQLNRKNYKFLGSLKNKEVIKWYKQNDVSVFVNLSSSEGVPVSIMEAMSLGIPVIATDVGGTKELVRDKVNGFLLNQYCNKSDVANTLIKFYQLEDNVEEKMRQSALNMWIQSCDAEKLYKEFAMMLRVS
ncbi:glycosyltransferase [Bacillus sp. FSL W7-1321]